jgi:DNA replication licensing factor MCM4
VDSRYNPSKNVVENINLPPTLLSRFDLIYLVLDKPNAESDRRLARHLVSLYHPRGSEDSIRSRQVQQEFLKDYIQYCRSCVSPEIGSDASEALIQGYLEMRAQGGRGAKTIAATPRQLESMIRLAQALAKMKLAEEVTGDDVAESIRLMKVATQAVATDPHTGKIDMGLLTAGRSTAEKDLREKLVSILEDLFASKVGQRLTVSQIRQLVSRDSDIQVRMDDVALAVQDMVARTTQVQFTSSTQTVFIRGRLD